MALDPFQEIYFVFTSRGKNRIKVLYWQRNGFCLWLKRLEKDKFVWPPLHQQEETLSISGEELSWLIDGFDIWKRPPHQTLNYRYAG